MKCTNQSQFDKNYAQILEGLKKHNHLEIQNGALKSVATSYFQRGISWIGLPTKTTNYVAEFLKKYGMQFASIQQLNSIKDQLNEEKRTDYKKVVKQITQYIKINPYQDSYKNSNYSRKPSFPFNKYPEFKDLHESIIPKKIRDLYEIKRTE